MGTKHGDLYARLKAEILGGKYGDAQALPSEVSLVRRFGVSRTTVQRALRDFEREGLIEKKPRKGSFVIPAERRNQTIGVVFPDAANADDVRIILASMEKAAGKRGFSVRQIKIKELS